MATAYQYSKLPPDSIRLLRLQPHRDPNAPIRCTLFDCPLLQAHDQVTFSPYEALSYVWGSTENPQSITVRDCPISYDDDDGSPATASAKKAGTLSVTRNLHEALVQLRDRFIDRVLWIDAICINQADLDERSCQVASMARIYAIASRVLVWLGPAADDGVAEALAKCVAPTRHHFPARAAVLGEWDESEEGEDESSSFDEPCSEASEAEFPPEAGPSSDAEYYSETESSGDGSVRHEPYPPTYLTTPARSRGVSKGARAERGDYTSLLTIFQRPWFGRTWVLQEAAAARHVLVLCGPVAIDGLALCARVQVIRNTGDVEPWSRMQSGVNLMKDTFRRYGHGGVGVLPGLANTASQQFSLAIAPLAGLLDMYLSRQATDVRDKVYALLGMCSDVIHTSGLTPDYSRPLGKFFDLVCQHLFGMAPISVKTCGERHVVAMRSRGRVLGHVQRYLRQMRLGRYELDMNFTTKGFWSRRSTWYVRVPTVRPGDIFFVLPGARWPMIGRVVGDSLLIIAAMASCDELDGASWPGTNAGFWSNNTDQPEKSKGERREDFWSADIWLLWDWSGTTEPLTHHRSEFLNDIFPSSGRLARQKSLLLICWSAGCYETAENCTKAFLEEYQHETILRERKLSSHDKASTKDMLDHGQLAVLSDAEQGLEMEFEALASQLPDCREKQGILGLWYLKCHLPPLCAEEERLLLIAAASSQARFDEFHPHPLYEEDLLRRAKRMREENDSQALPPLRRCRSWPQVPKPPAKQPSQGRAIEPGRPLSSGTDQARKGHFDNRSPNDDLGEECMIVAMTESTYLTTPEDWLWFRLASHRRGQGIRVTTRVFKALVECSKRRPEVAESILQILYKAPRDIFVGLEELPINQELYNDALSRGERDLARIWRRLLRRRGEHEKALRMEARAHKNIKVLKTLERYRRAVELRSKGILTGRDSRPLGYSVR